jgi:hypothetical protein
MKKKPPTKQRGPRPENLKIDGSWKNAVKRSFLKKRPAEGWPKENK